jgi:hypothetical protein
VVLYRSVVLTHAHVTIAFDYYSLGLITVECTRNGEPRPYFLEALFPGATTDISPAVAPAVAHAALDAGVTAAGGYDWAQWIAGLSPGIPRPERPSHCRSSRVSTAAFEIIGTGIIEARAACFSVSRHRREIILVPNKNSLKLI